MRRSGVRSSCRPPNSRWHLSHLRTSHLRTRRSHARQQKAVKRNDFIDPNRVSGSDPGICRQHGGLARGLPLVPAVIAPQCDGLVRAPQAQRILVASPTRREIRRGRPPPKNRDRMAANVPPFSGISLGRAHTLASFVAEEVRRTGRRIDQLTPVGSMRRYARSKRVAACHGTRGPTRRRVRRAGGPVGEGHGAQPFDRSHSRGNQARPHRSIHLHARSSRGGAGLAHRCGRARAAPGGPRREPRAGIRSGHADRRGPGRAVPTEDDLYRHLGLPYVAPELREGADEIEAAEQDRLPQLLTPLHIRGDLHTHSRWSDGRDSVEQMVAAAGNSDTIIAITDHSERAPRPEHWPPTTWPVRPRR